MSISISVQQYIVCPSVYLFSNT